MPRPTVRIPEVIARRRIGRLKDIQMLTSKRVCVLCSETRCLEQAHLIPVAFYKHAGDSTRRKNYPDYMKYAIYLCPTHHKCYDKLALNDTERERMVQITRQLKPHFEHLLDHLEPRNTHDPKVVAVIDKWVNDMWLWWREYIYAS